MTSKKLYYLVRCGKEPIQWQGKTIQAGRMFSVPEYKVGHLPKGCTVLTETPLTPRKLVKRMKQKK